LTSYADPLQKAKKKREKKMSTKGRGEKKNSSHSPDTKGGFNINSARETTKKSYVSISSLSFTAPRCKKKEGGKINPYPFSYHTSKEKHI